MTWNGYETEKFSASRIMEFLRLNARGYSNRVKIQTIGKGAFALDDVPHGSAADVGIRAAVSDLAAGNEPIATKGGPHGGVWWMVTEDDRQIALDPLRSLLAAVERRVKSLEGVTL